VLFDTHSEVWFASGNDVTIGETAKQKILQLVA
jgi:hypothetical protein